MQRRMKYVYAKDSDGFVSKKEASKVCDDEVVISKDEFERLSGDSFYKEKFQSCFMQSVT